jgi:hypothetical protein
MNARSMELTPGTHDNKWSDARRFQLPKDLKGTADARSWTVRSLLNVTSAKLAYAFVGIEATSISAETITAGQSAREMETSGIRSLEEFLTATWQLHNLLFWQTVNFCDGSSQRGGRVFRRKRPGESWQYRSYSDDW